MVAQVGVDRETGRNQSVVRVSRLSVPKGGRYWRGHRHVSPDTGGDRRGHEPRTRWWVGTVGESGGVDRGRGGGNGGNLVSSTVASSPGIENPVTITARLGSARLPTVQIFTGLSY